MQGELIKLDIVGTQRDETGEVRVSLGDALSGEGYVSNASLWAADGFFGVPVEAGDDGGAAQGIYHVDGNTVRVMATKDNRFVDKYAELEPGDRAIVTDGPARFFLKRTQDLVSLYTETASGKPLMVSVRGDEGRIDLHCEGSNGASMIQMTDDTIKLTAGGTFVEIGPDGLSVYGKHCALNTGSGNLGTLGLSPPVVGPQSLIFGVSGMAGVASTGWTVAK